MSVWWQGGQETSGSSVPICMCMCALREEGSISAFW